LTAEIFVVFAGGNPYPGMEMDETFITRLKNGYRMEKPKLAPDAVYARFSCVLAVISSILYTHACLNVWMIPY